MLHKEVIPNQKPAVCHDLVIHSKNVNEIITET